MSSTDRSASDVPAGPLREAQAATALLALARAVGREPTLDRALRAALDAVQALWSPRSAFVAVHDRSSDRLVIAASRGRSDPRIAAGPADQGPQGQAFQTGALVWTPPMRKNARGSCAVPLCSAGRTVGSLVLIGPTFAESGPSDGEREVLEAISAIIGGAVRAQHLREEAERRWREQQTSAEALRVADRERDDHLSHISHELRTPLFTVKSWVSLALGGALGPVPEKVHHGLTVVQRNADRLLHLINDLILTARLRAGQMTLDPRPLGLRSLLEEAANLMESDLAARGATLSIAPGPEAFVRGNRDRLVETVMHLLERAMRAGGQVKAVVSSEGREGKLIIRAGEERSGTGSGKPAEGDGGLTIARRILDLHGGSLQHSGGRSAIQLTATLPLYAGALAPPSPGMRRAGEVLVVEDDTDCRDVLVEALREAGFAASGVADGAAALDRLRKAEVALVLLDLRIPKVDGQTVLREMRRDARLADVPVFVISGAIDAPAGQRQAWGERVDLVFEKPIQLPWLMEQVRERVAPLVERA